MKYRRRSVINSILILSEYQSAQEDQSDSPPEYTVEESGDESDDVIEYDFTERPLSPL